MLPVKLRYGLNYLVNETKFQILWKALHYVRKCNIEGDYIEFGVSKGDSIIEAYNQAQLLGLKEMCFIGFDSFEGLPEPDKEEKDEFSKGQFKCNFEFVKKRTSIKKRIILNKCWFDEFKNKRDWKFKHKKACIIMLDCDLYTSTKEALDFIKDKIQDGTVLLFDEWYYFKARKDRGNQKAFYEFKKKNKDLLFQDFHNYGWGAKAIIVNTK